MVSYLAVIALVTSADGLMSYGVPVIINQHVATEAVMGLIIAFSSVVGLLCDFLFARFFRQKTFLFFLALTLLSALLFPLSISFLPSIVPVFLLATGIWGVYYETLAYSNFSFIARFVPLEKHERAWGLFSTIKAVAWTIAPIVASFLLISGEQSVFFLAILLLSLAAAMALLSKQRWHKAATPVQIAKPHTNNIAEQWRVWRLLFKTVWPLFIFYGMLYVIDAAFWTIGTVMAESLKELTIWGGFLISAYMLPSVLFSNLASPAAKPFGKKRISFILGIGSGLLLALVAVIRHPEAIVGVVFLFASLQAIIWPEMYAVFENYITRLKEHGVDMVGLQASVSSLAYIIGPIFAGFAAALIGNQATFGVLGMMFAIISVVLLIVVPRKIRMPQKELEQLSSS